MALDTYANLQTAIIEYAMRQGDAEFIARVPDFIALTEKRVQRDLRTASMEASATVTLTSGSGSLPADYVSFRRVASAANPSRVLDLISPDQAVERFPDDVSGIPSYFTIIGSTIKTYPRSEANLTLNYYQAIPALSVSNTTNWLLTKAPDIYLYGALLEGSLYMNDTEAVTRWGTVLERAMRDFKRSDTTGRFARFSPRRIGPTP